jgi:hypothetical protein
MVEDALTTVRKEILGIEAWELFPQDVVRGSCIGYSFSSTLVMCHSISCISCISLNADIHACRQTVIEAKTCTSPIF